MSNLKNHRILELHYRKTDFLKEHGKNNIVWFGFFKSKSTLKVKPNTLSLLVEISIKISDYWIIIIWTYRLYHLDYRLGNLTTI
jgi:hypothetical protein